MITPVTAGRPYSLEQMLDRITPGNSPGERCRDEAGGPANLLNASYIPERGDLVWLDFPNQEGQGPGGRRPALVLSPGSYNGKAGLALMCPVITRLKGYPFEVEIPGDCRIWGGVLADQVKIKDWRGRRAEFIRRLPGPVIGDVLARLALLLS
jgi:mRNA interferase MazF